MKITNSSKAAAAMLTDTLRLELAPFNIKVVDLKTGAVQSHFWDNQAGGETPSLPAGSIYLLAKDRVEKRMTGEWAVQAGITADQWADQVVKALSSSWWRWPPVQVWKGKLAGTIWFVRGFLPFTIMDLPLSQRGGMDVVKQRLQHPSS